MAEPPLAGRAVGAFRWSALAAVADALLGLAILAVLARVLAPREFGVIAIAMVFIGVIQAAGRLGIGPAIVQRPGLTDRHVATGFALSAGLGAILSAALWAAAPAAGRFFDDPEVPAVLAALAAIFAVSGTGEVSEHLLRRGLRFRELMVAGILSQTAGYALVAIALALAGHGVWSLVGGLLARHALYSATVLVLRPPALRAGPGRREAAQLLRFGTGFSANALLTALAGHGGRFLMGSALGAAPLGLYVQAARVAGAPARLRRVVQSVLFPAMAERQTRPDRLRPVYLHGIEAVSLLALCASVLLAVCAPELVAVLFGGQWEAAVPVLRILAAGVALHVCNVVNVPTIRALGTVWPETWRRGVFAALLILGVWLGIRWGIAGAAAGIVVARIALHVLLTHLVLRLLGLGLPRLLRCHAPALWTAAWSGAALWLATDLARTAGWPDAATLAAGAAAWAGAAAAAVRAAPDSARPRAIRWALEHLPFAGLGSAAAPLRRLLKALDGGADVRAR